MCPRGQAWLDEAHVADLFPEEFDLNVEFDLAAEFDLADANALILKIKATDELIVQVASNDELEEIRDFLLDLDLFA